MNKLQIFEMIDEYLDGELSNEKEPILFSELSASKEARNYFRQLQLLKLSAKSAEEEYPAFLDARILNSFKKVPEHKPYFNRVITYAASATAVILIVLTFLIYGEVREYKTRVAELDLKVKEQYNTIEMLYNSLPTITVKPAVKNY